MIDSTWPDEPHRRKAVLVLNQQDIDALSYEEGGADLLLNEEVHILPFSTQQSNPVIQDLINSGIARPGTVLIQSPFDKNRYENSQKAVERFALDKHLHFSSLCGFLGAREVKVEHIDLKNTEGTTTFSVGADTIKGRGNVKIENKELDSFYHKLELHDSFQGCAPDVPAAEEHLKQTGLSGNADMRNLIDLRRNPNNLLTSRKIKLNLTSETQRNLDVLANLDVPVFLSLEAGYKRQVREQTEFILTVKVDF